MTTLEELLTMMAEDAAKTVKPEKRPPPIPPKKTEAIRKEELESLDDGPVLKDGLWPSALPRPARRGPPPPPPGRRARGTSPLSENVTSGLIDVRAMAMAYERARTAEVEAAAEPAPADAVIEIPPAAEPPPEPAPTPVMAEGTKPFPAVVEEATEPEAEAEAEAEADEPADPRRGLWLLIARRAAVVAAFAGLAALAVNFVVNRARSEGAASDPIDYAARVAPSQPAAVVPAEAPVAVPAPEPALEPVVITQPTVITEVESAPAAEPTPPAATDEIIDEPATSPQPAIARSDDQPAPAARPAKGEPPPELLADGCFDAACAVTAPRARRPAPPAEEVVMVPARLPTRPSNSEIASAIFAAQDQIEGCGDVYGQSGPVPLKIRIAASGAITSVAVGEGTTRFRTCVSDIVRRLRMPASLIGTSASFPVLIR